MTTPSPLQPLRSLPSPRSLGRWLREGALTVAAAGGVLCILAVVAATTLHLSLVLFRTGSMTPAIPAGSVALIRHVPADEVEPGDVVTVDRPGRLPVTHRVVIAEPGPDGTTRLTLQGDANPSPDPGPYDVTRVGKVVASVPGIASVVSSAGHPAVLAAVTLAAAALVTWAFWPRRDGELSLPAPAGAGESR